MQRRRFLSSAMAAAVVANKGMAIAQAMQSSGAGSIPRVSNPGTMRGEMLYRKLGATGIEVSVIGMGGSHIGQAKVQEDLAIRLIHEALDRGINFLDNSWDYNEGWSKNG